MGPTRIALIISACAWALRAEAYNVPIEIQFWDTKSPQDYLVDVINEFGLKVLNEHNFLNENNVAFSPYGLAGILVALYEGVEGDSSYEILRGMQLPWNRNVLRVGFRDIHRNLKTYFVPDEGFLAGLALNKDNIEFKENYRTILAFYGFDVGNDTNSKETNSTSSSVSDIPTTTMKLEADDSREETTPKINTAEAANAEPEEISTTPNTPLVNAVTDMPVKTETMGTTNMPATSLTNSQTADNGSASETTSEMTTLSLTNTVTSLKDDVEILTSSTNVVTETAPASTGVQVRLPLNTDTSMLTNADASTESETSINDSLATSLGTSLKPQSTLSEFDTDQTSPLSTELTFQNSVPTTQSMMPSETTTEADSAITGSATDDTNTEIVSEPKTSITVTIDEATMTNAAIQNSEAFTTETPMPDKTTEQSTRTSRLTKLKRQKKSLIDFILSEPSFLEPIFFPRTTFNYIVPETPKFRTESAFLAHGLKTVEVPYMVYDTVLEYAYLPHFSAAALKLPLDSPNYYLLIILPDYSYDINRLTKRLARESNLRDIYSALKFRHVYASVPSFMVKGHVSLTTDLQRLGIRNVFEPRQRDFGPMTSQDNVYVRSVEQDITVTIRKYLNSSALIRYGPVSSAYPVQFLASYPFLFFVMDAGAHVSLMAGKILDPLNSRIL